MRDLTILITGVGSMVANSIIKNYKIVKERKIRIIGTDIKETVATTLIDKYYQIMKPQDENFIEKIIEICQKEKVEFIIPLVDSELPVFAKNKELFLSKNITICLNDYEKINLMLNKYELYRYLEKANINIPKCQLVKTNKDFIKASKYLDYPNSPFSFKPIIGSGSRGFRIVDNSIDLLNTIFKEKPNSKYVNYESVLKVMKSSNDIPELVAMEYLSGALYNVNVLAKEGETIYIASGKVIDFELGNTMKCIIENKRDINDYCKRIVKLLNLTGNIGFEVAYDKNNVLKIIEINPRIQGQIVSSTAAGINFPYLELKMHLNEPLPKLVTKDNITMIRYWEETFIDDKKSYKINI